MSDDRLRLVNLPLREARQLDLTYRRGDPDAAAFFDEMKN
jgi:hypothetical protein